MHWLFSYGTLQFEHVQKDTFGRVLIGNKDVLDKYVLSTIKINDAKVIASSGTNMHPILVYTGNEKDFVEGMVYEISDKELSCSDKYEVDAYKRVKATFKSGMNGFVYVRNK
jgi:hypothetical protein